MQTINHIENWLLFILFVGVLALQVWALVDCITRKAPAFPAAGKLTKPTWILLTAVAVAPVSSVYLADVRPAVREISGPSRW